jgi:agmatinase
MVYLSVDVDVMDPGFAPGTGTPEPGGLSAREMLRAVRRIALAVPMAGMDVVEVSPPYDQSDITAEVAHRICLEVISALAARRLNEGTGAGGAA